MIIFLIVMMISFSCNQSEKKRESQEINGYATLDTYNDQIFKKIDDFFQYQFGLIDTTMNNGICKIEISTHDPYGISTVTDTFISISMLYCAQYYEKYNEAFIYDNQIIVVFDKEDLANILLTNVDMFFLPMDSITCINTKIKTIFTYITDDGKLKEWIYPFK